MYRRQRFDSYWEREIILEKKLWSPRICLCFSHISSLRSLFYSKVPKIPKILLSPNSTNPIWLSFLSFKAHRTSILQYLTPNLPKLELSTFPQNEVLPHLVVLYLNTQHHNPSSSQSTIMESSLTSPYPSLDGANHSPNLHLHNPKNQSTLCPYAIVASGVPSYAHGVPSARSQQPTGLRVPFLTPTMVHLLLFYEGN